MESLKLKDLIVGGVFYDVAFEDCYIAGEFASTVVAVDTERDMVTFGNGVTLTNTRGVEFRLRTGRSDG